MCQPCLSCGSSQFKLIWTSWGVSGGGMFPVNLNLERRLFLLVGAGRVGRRKLDKLLKAGARGRVVELRPAEDILAWGRAGRLEIFPEYQSDLLDGVSLVFAAASDRELNRRVAEEAAGRGLWVNVADDPGRSDFELPAVVERGDFRLTVSTSGQSPALAARTAERLRRDFGPEYGLLTRFLGRLRPLVLTSPLNPSARQDFFKHLLESESLLEALAAGDEKNLEKLLKELLSPLGLSGPELNSLRAD